MIILVASIPCVGRNWAKVKAFLGFPKRRQGRVSPRQLWVIENLENVLIHAVEVDPIHAILVVQVEVVLGKFFPRRLGHYGE